MMTEANLTSIPHHAKYNLAKPVDGSSRYIITAYNLPAGHALVLRGYAKGGGLIIAEIRETPATIEIELGQPILFAECRPTEFDLHLAQGKRPTRLDPT